MACSIDRSVIALFDKKFQIYIQKLSNNNATWKLKKLTFVK